VADPSLRNKTNNSAFNRVSRFTIDPSNPNVADPTSEVVLLDNIPESNGEHVGGLMAFGADGDLYLGVGDAGIGANAQDLSSLNGKILRLDVTHFDPANPASIIPADNPFVGQ